MADNLLEQFRQITQRSIGAPILILVMILIMILPLAPFILDILFTFNITLSLIILVTVIYVKRPLEFNVFPTILLLATLLRLGLNVASTRVVLLHGHQGSDAAGEVIKAFGEVVIGGNYTVGFVVFLILVIINFVVVTKGAGRVSEVSARFTLDAMPGKQMAIDADLSAGLITQDEALKRRAEVTQEADFYGAMDGASKFVRGDAIAGILVLCINIIGGVAIGMNDHGMGFTEAFRNYALLTIGDGLVAQIPALLLSTGSAIMVTRVTSSHDMTALMMEQLVVNPRPLAITSAVLASLAVIPGMPHFAFMGLALIAGISAYVIFQNNERKTEAEKVKKPTEVKEKEKVTKELDWDDVTSVDRLGLEIGYRLISLVGPNRDGQLISRIKGVRKKLSQSLGFLIPQVHIRDNLELPPTKYRITLLGVVQGEGELIVDRMLAIDPGKVYGKIEGTPAKDPTYGLDAVWINQGQRDQAQSLGYTVVDPSTVIATHLSQIIQDHAGELLGHEETQQLLERLSKTSPKLVEAMTPAIGLSLSVTARVLQRLLKANIPIIDLRTIAEALVDLAPKTQDFEQLIEGVRVSLRRLIIQKINGPHRELAVITFDPELEQLLHKSLHQPAENKINKEPTLIIEPNLAEKIMETVEQLQQRCDKEGKPAIIVVARELRVALEKFLHAGLRGLYVLSYAEIPEDKQIKVIGNIGR